MICLHPCLSLLFNPVDRSLPPPSLSLSLRFPKYRLLYLLRWIHILAPQLATRDWTRISTRWLYLGPVGADCDAVGRPTGTRRREQNRNARIRDTRGEKARRRIEIRIDPRKSSGTRPIFGYSCDRSSLFLLSTLLLPLFFFLPCFPFPLPDRTLPTTPDLLLVCLAQSSLVSLTFPFTFGQNP